MKENHKNILIIIALLIVSCFFYITIRDNQILKQQNEQFLNDKSFYQKELGKIQTSLYRVENMQQQINNTLNKWFNLECNLE